MVLVCQVETWMNNSVQGCQLLNGIVWLFLGSDMDRSAIGTVFHLRPSSISQTMAAPLTIDSSAPFHQSGSQMVSCFQRLSCHSWVLMRMRPPMTLVDLHPSGTSQMFCQLLFSMILLEILSTSDIPSFAGGLLVSVE